jgi:multiple sugar transport system ATP-binding protein
MNLIKGAPAAKRGAETIGIRPEHIDVSTTAGEWPATVRIAEHLGSDTFVYAESDGIGALTLRLEGEAPLTAGQNIFVSPREAHLHRFDKDGRRIN